MKIQKEYNHCQLTTQCVDCASNSMCGAWVEFVKKHGDIKSYAHFDRRVSLSMPSIRKYVMDVSRIVKHGFYPFIHFEKKFSRYCRNYKKKKIRNLYYCSHLDRCVYQRYAFLINFKYNIWVSRNDVGEVAVAYRDNQGKNNIDIVKYAFDSIKSFQKCFIMIGDFSDFFDKIDHDYLKSMLCKILGVKRLPQDYFSVFRNITRFASFDWKDIIKVSGEDITASGIRKKINSKNVIITREQFTNNKNYIKKNVKGVGIPQGSPISAVLSNVYMIDIDTQINNYVTHNSGIYMRYSDDFIIILPFHNEEEVAVYKDFILSVFKNIVDLQDDKTSYYIFNDNKLYENNIESNIDYLGFLFDGQNIKLRPRSITRYYYRMRRKAHTIGRRNWISPSGKHIFAKNIYNIYSHNNSKYKQTFIDYIRKAKRILSINDSEADALIKYHKQKISKAIKESMK